MLTVSFLLLVAAFICNIGAALGRVPLWIGVILLTIWALLTVIPLR